MAALFLLVSILIHPVSAESVKSTNELKASLVYYCAVLTEWPKDAIAQSNSNFVIGVLGNDPVYEILKAAPDLVQGRKLEVRRMTNVVGAETCHLLLVGTSKTNSLPQIFAYLKDASVLTVGEEGEFLRAGGMIKIWEERRKATVKFHFDLNLEAARRAKLNLRQLIGPSESEPKKR